MTGIVGFTFCGDHALAEARLNRMLAAVTDDSGYCVDSWVGDGVALGRVSLGRLDRHSQPIWNENKTLCIVFEGEIFAAGALRAQLEAAGHQLALGNSAELLLHLWEEEGEHGLLALNGAFTFAIWNTLERTLVVGNDRFGFRHIYYTAKGEDSAFACGVRGLLANELLPSKVDYVGIAQALHFEHLLGERTYVEDVKLLPPAGLLHLHDGSCKLHRYWRWSLPGAYQLRTRGEYKQQLLHLMQQGVARQLPGTVRGGMNLSGGLDSRMLFGVLGTQMDVQDLRTFTFGIPNCDDVRIAQQIARFAGAPHLALPLAAGYLSHYAQIGVRLTDGMDSCIHIHALANLAQQAPLVDFLYTGYYVDSITDTDGTRETLVRFDDDTSLQFLYNYMHRLFPNDQDEEIFTESFLAASREEFSASFHQMAMETKGDTLSEWLESVEIVHRQRRLTQFGNDLVRWKLECRNPFCDTELVDFCLALPPALRMDRFLFTQTFVDNFHKLAKVPNDRTGMPFVVDARYLSLQAQINARWLLYRFGLASEPRHRRKTYARYDIWFRTALREWVEKTLLDARSMQRGILKPAALQRIVQEHMMGAADHTREIGMLLSIELWHRSYMD